MQFPSSKETGDAEKVEKSPFFTGHFGKSLALTLPDKLINNKMARDVLVNTGFNPSTGYSFCIGSA
jgi:hypothetical protein